MKVFAFADAHLSFATPGKEMHIFGENWRDHPRKIEANWRELVGDDDLVLLAGDTSWAMRWREALPDLEFLDCLPGRKVLIRGNHDYWWSTLKKVREFLPPSFTALDGDAAVIGEVGVCGTRLWEGPGLSFAEIAPATSLSTGVHETDDAERNLKIWGREVQRLQRALGALERLGRSHPLRAKIAMVHYPPCDWRLTANEVTSLVESAGVSHVVFGHLHAVRPVSNESFFGERNGVRYHLAASDYLDFRPLLIEGSS